MQGQHIQWNSGHSWGGLGGHCAVQRKMGCKDSLWNSMGHVT